METEFFNYFLEYYKESPFLIVFYFLWRIDRRLLAIELRQLNRVERGTYVQNDGVTAGDFPKRVRRAGKRQAETDRG